MLERLTGGHNPRFVEEEMGDTEFELYQRLELLEQRMELAVGALAQQAVDGNWDANHYMLGLYNGMECIVGIMEGREVNYRQLDALDGTEPDMEECGRTEVDSTFLGEGEGIPQYIEPDYPTQYDGPEGYIPGVVTGASDEDDGDLDGGNIDVDPEFLNT